MGHLLLEKRVCGVHVDGIRTRARRIHVLLTIIKLIHNVWHKLGQVVQRLVHHLAHKEGALCDALREWRSSGTLVGIESDEDDVNFSIQKLFHGLGLIPHFPKLACALAILVRMFVDFAEDDAVGQGPPQIRSTDVGLAILAAQSGVILKVGRVAYRFHERLTDDYLDSRRRALITRSAKTYATLKA